MEFKLKLKYALLVSLFFIIIIAFDWYKNIDYIAKYDEKIEENISSEELSSLSKAYKVDYNESYYWYNVNSIKKTKTMIPFVFDKEILSSTKRELIQNPHQ